MYKLPYSSTNSHSCEKKSSLLQILHISKRNRSAIVSFAFSLFFFVLLCFIFYPSSEQHVKSRKIFSKRFRTIRSIEATTGAACSHSAQVGCRIAFSRRFSGEYLRFKHESRTNPNDWLASCSEGPMIRPVNSVTRLFKHFHEVSLYRTLLF